MQARESVELSLTGSQAKGAGDCIPRATTLAAHEQRDISRHVRKIDSSRVPESYGFTATTWHLWVSEGLPHPPEDQEPAHPSDWTRPEDWERHRGLAVHKCRWESFGFDPPAALQWQTDGWPVPPPPTEDLHLPCSMEQS